MLIYKHYTSRVHALIGIGYELFYGRNNERIEDTKVF